MIQSLVSNTLNIWSPHSPDLNALYLFLQGYFKDDVYINKPATRVELKNNVTGSIGQITLDMCRRVLDNFKQRIQTCIDHKGGHIEHLDYNIYYRIYYFVVTYI